MAFRLTITAGKGQGREFDFTKDAVKIGRLSDNDLVLYEPGVSRYHCEILKDERHYTLRDVGSSNGTLLNGVLTTEAELSEGDRIQLGPITFQFHAGVEIPESRRRLTGGPAAVARPENTEVRREIEEDQTAALSRRELQTMRDKQAAAEPFDSPSARSGRTVLVSEAEAGADTKAGAKASAAAEQLDSGVPPAFAGGHDVGRLKAWLSELSPRSRLGLVAMVALVVVVLVTAVVLRGPRDRSQEVFPISADTTALRYGVGRVDVHTPDRASFSFVYESGRAELTYTAGGVDSDKDIKILLNGTSIGGVPIASAWTPGFRLLLPRKLLRAGTNVVTFDQVGVDQRWGISQVQVIQTPLPAPNQDKARELFELGQASYDTRKVTPQNLYRSIHYLQQAALHLEGSEEPLPLLLEIEAARQAAERELRTVHDDLIFAARRAQRFGNHAEAVEALRQLLRHYPDATDPRHQEVRRLLSDMVGDANR